MAIKKIHQKGNKHNNNSECEIYFFEVENVNIVHLRKGAIKKEQKAKVIA